MPDREKLVVPKAGIRGGFEKLTADLMGRKFRRENGGEVTIDRMAIDASYEPAIIYSFCRAYGDSRVTPQHGRYIGASSVPWEQFKKQDGEQLGHHWLRPSMRGRKLAVRHYVADSNYWKSFVHARLSADSGSGSEMTLFGKSHDAMLHRGFCEHMLAEFCVATSGRGRDVGEWKVRPGKDNHWFDCLVGTAVLACVEGCSLPEWNRSRASLKNPDGSQQPKRQRRDREIAVDFG